MRDYLLQMEPSPPSSIKDLFLKHAKTWMTPDKVALHLLTGEADLINFVSLRRTEPVLEELLWSNEPINSFFCQATLQSPCLIRGTTEDWQAFKNNNMSCERLVGWTKNCIQNKNVCDSSDDSSNEQIAAVDERIRGFINCTYYDF